MLEESTASEEATEISYIFDTSELTQKGKQFVIYENRIVNVEDFKHPGAQKLITDNLGKDVTELFNDIDHSSAAREMIENMTIGYVAKNEGKLLENKYINVSNEEKEMHSRLDSLIDIKKPLIPQVSQLTNAEFKAFVKRPRFIQDEDGIQLFEDKNEDEKSKCYFQHNVMVLGSYIVLCLTLAYFECASFKAFLWQLPLQFLIGSLMMWTFIEYFFHRFMLHNELHLDDNAKPDPQYLAEIFKKHIYHHVFMNQRNRIPQSLHTLVTFLAGGHLLMYFTLPAINQYLLGAAFASGCLFYDWAHLAYHFEDTMPKWLRNTYWFQSMQEAHLHHHFRDNSTEFGVTTDMWDRVYGTERAQKAK